MFSAGIGEADRAKNAIFGHTTTTRQPKLVMTYLFQVSNPKKTSIQGVSKAYIFKIALRPGTIMRFLRFLTFFTVFGIQERSYNRAIKMVLTYSERGEKMD